MYIYIIDIYIYKNTYHGLIYIKMLYNTILNNININTIVNIIE